MRRRIHVQPLDASFLVYGVSSCEEEDTVRRRIHVQPLDASFLFYSAINGAESLDANRKREALNAASVDKIMQMQRKQFLAQASYLHFDQETQSPFKIKTPAGQADQESQALATEAGLQIETINFIKLPPGLYGLKALQLALHELLSSKETEIASEREID